MFAKKVLISILSLCGIGIAWLMIDAILWHPLQSEKLKYDLFGGEIDDIEIGSRVDFVGIDIHGDIFDFYEYKINPDQLKKLIATNQLANFPVFSAEVFDGVNKKVLIESEKWTSTSLVVDKGNYIYRLLRYGNFHDHKATKRFVEADYLKKTNNYIAFCNSYSQGFNLYVLVPEENKLFIVRKRD